MRKIKSVTVNDFGENLIWPMLSSIIEFDDNMTVTISGHIMSRRVKVPFINRFVRLVERKNSDLTIEVKSKYDAPIYFWSFQKKDFPSILSIEKDIRQSGLKVHVSDEDMDFIIATIYDLFEPFSIG
jgi:hypothetical protein